MPASGSRHSRRSSRYSLDDELRGEPLHAADVWLFATIFYGLMLFVLTHLSPEALPDFVKFAPGDDVYAHGFAYFFLGMFVCRTFDAQYRRAFRARAPILWYAIVFFGCAAFGFIDEETQPLAGRVADAADWEADLFGAAFGVCAHLVIEIFLVADELPLKRRRRRRRRSRSGEHREAGHSANGSEHRRRRRRRRHREPDPLADAPNSESAWSGEPTEAGSGPAPTSPNSSSSSGERRRRRRHRRRRRDEGGDLG